MAEFYQDDPNYDGCLNNSMHLNMQRIRRYWNVISDMMQDSTGGQNTAYVNGRVWLSTMRK